MQGDGFDEPRRPPRARPVAHEPRDLGDDPVMRLVMPVGLTGWAIAAGYLGLVSVLCFPAPFALLTGLLAVRAMRRNRKLHGMGRAVFGIVMGILGSIGLVFMLVALVSAGMNPKR